MVAVFFPAIPYGCQRWFEYDKYNNFIFYKITVWGSCYFPYRAKTARFFPLSIMKEKKLYIVNLDDFHAHYK